MAGTGGSSGNGSSGGVGGTSAFGGRLLGTNDLQTTVDKFTQAVSNLTSTVAQMAGQTGGSGSLQMSTTPGLGTGATGATFTSGQFPKMMSTAAGNQGAFTSPPSGRFQGAAVMGSGGNGNISPPTSQSTSGNGGYGAAGMAIGAGMARGIMGYGASQMSPQLAMNAYYQQAALAAPGASWNGIYGGAFGVGNNNLNNMALSPADAAQGAATMSWASGGQPFIYGQPMTGMQSATMSAATAAGFTNPGIGYAGASQVAASIYNPTTSLAMRQMGYGVTPRQAQGSANMNPNSMGQVVQSMLQRWYGGKTSVSSSTLNAALAQGGIGALNLQALGLNPQTMTPIMQGYNDLYQKGVSASQANTLFTNAEMSTNTSTRNQAFQQLQKYGLPTSMLQQLKNSQAELTGRDTETSQGFNQGLSAAASSLNLFNSALNSLLNGPLGKLAGVAGGFGGGIGGSSVGGLLNKGLDLAGAAGIGKVLLGGSGGSGILSKVGSYIGDLFKGGGGGGGEMLSGIFGGAITAGGSSLSSSASSQSGGSSATSGTVTNKQVVTAVKDAESQLGKPYVWGGDSPATSFDCSGLVQWAYGQAGVKLPRTSQQQWASLQSKSVPMDKVQEGDLVFMAGSDGTANNPGHVGMMINSKQLIQAPYTGASIDVIAYDPGQWQHAARPVGGTSGVSNGSSAPTANASGQGNSGAGAGNTMGLLPGNYGSSEESANTASALAGGIATGGGGVWGGTGNSQTGATGSGGTNAGSSGGTDASASSLQKYAFSLFGKFGWGANQQQPLVNLWNKESNWRSNAQNPTSTAYGIAQFLNSTWAGYGPKTSNADLQILYGEEYIKQRYGSPAGAWAHETAYNWYGSGTGGAQAGLALVGDRGPEIVNFSGGEKVANASQTAAMLTGSAAGAAQAPWRTGPLASLWMANTPQNQSQMSGKCDINFNFPANAISVQVASLSNTSDISSAVSQMVNGLTTAMAQSSLVQNIANGNKG